MERARAANPKEKYDMVLKYLPANAVGLLTFLTVVYSTMGVC